MRPHGTPLKDALLGNRTAAAWSGLKFYLHQGGAFNFTDRVKCYFRALGVSMHEANMDHLVLPNIAEHTTDVWLLEHLRSHPGRVSRPGQADIHIIGAPIGLSYHAASLPGNPCGTTMEHHMRVRALMDQMTKTREFKRHGGRSWLLMDSDWDWSKHILPRRFVDLVKSEHMLLATVDRDISSFGQVAPEDTILIPYKAQNTLDLNGEMLTAFLNIGAPDRMFSFTFHGNMDRKTGDAQRSIMRNITLDLEATSVEEASFYNQHPRAFGPVTDRTATVMMESVFCFVPAGDTASSRRLFDALAAGCVPIIFNDFETAVNNLPFAHSIDWEKLAYFGGSLDCVAKNVGHTKDWLRTLWKRRGDADVVQKQKLGRQTFLDTLSYRGGDLVSAMLAEVGLVRAARRPSSA